MVEEVHDREVLNPSYHNRIHSCKFIPGRIAGSTEIPDTDPNSDSAASDNTKPVWKKRRTRNDVLALQYRNKLKLMEAARLNRQLTFTPGANVSTDDPRIADEMEEELRPGRKYKARKTLYGKVIKQSPYFPRFWLVKFSGKEKNFYVTEEVVTFLDKNNIKPDIAKGVATNQALMKKIDEEVQNNKEIILTNILHAKVVELPDVDLCTYEGVCHLYKKEYTWLNADMIKYHTYALRRTVDVVPAGTWLHRLPDPWYRGSWEDKIQPKPAVTPSKYIYSIIYDLFH